MTGVRMRWLLPLMWAAATAYGQSAPAPRFEVASVKPGGDIFSTRPNLSRGRIRWTTQLTYLIGYAYRLDSSLVSGPQTVYALEATFDPAATDDQVRLMIQSLLAERFKMMAHRVTTEADGYGLSIGKGGLKIREAKAAEAPAAADEAYISATIPEAGVTAVTGRGVPMSQLAERLQRLTGVPVWDRTGLTRNYDFAFRYAADPDVDPGTDVPSLGTALQDGLGLRLVKQKGPVETLVIDSIAAPAEN
jgi:uncharacterized protein (TIGR03435 family)